MSLKAHGETTRDEEQELLDRRFRTHPGWLWGGGSPDGPRGRRATTLRAAGRAALDEQTGPAGHAGAAGVLSPGGAAPRGHAGDRERPDLGERPPGSRCAAPVPAGCPG